MKIAYDYQTFTLQAYGGISRYFFKLADELKNAGDEVKIFAPYHCNQLITTLGQNTVSGKQISSRDFSKPKALALLVFNQIITKRAIDSWKPDVVHETYYAFRRSASAKQPIVISVYDMIHEKLPHFFNRLDPTSYLKRLAVTRADHIICISESTRKDLIELFPFTERKASVVHLSFSSFPTVKEQNQASQPYLLYVGSRSGHKNFNNLVLSFARSEKLKSDFDLVAFGGGEFSAAEQRMLADLGLRTNQVRQITGNDELLAGYYKHAAAFVYPSFYEGFGLPPLEAMAQRCPVVSSNTSSMLEVIGDAGEFFDPNSVEQIATAIEGVVFSELRRAQLVRLGEERLKKFSWEKCAMETRQIYQSLI